MEQWADSRKLISDDTGNLSKKIRVVRRKVEPKKENQKWANQRKVPRKKVRRFVSLKENSESLSMTSQVSW